jgi:hypothetical protein
MADLSAIACMVPETLPLLFSACDRYLPHTDQPVGQDKHRRRTGEAKMPDGNIRKKEEAERQGMG